MITAAQIQQINELVISLNVKLNAALERERVLVALLQGIADWCLTGEPSPESENHDN